MIYSQVFLLIWYYYCDQFFYQLTQFFNTFETEQPNMLVFSGIKEPKYKNQFINYIKRSPTKSSKNHLNVQNILRKSLT
jgi:hypothetical protein